MLLEDAGRPVAGPTPTLGDSKAARDWVVKEGSTKRTRHYDRSIAIVKRLFMIDVIAPWLVSTDKMVADIFTKALDKETFYRHREYLCNQDNGPVPVMNGKMARLWNKLTRVAAMQ